MRQRDCKYLTMCIIFLNFFVKFLIKSAMFFRLHNRPLILIGNICIMYAYKNMNALASIAEMFFCLSCKISVFAHVRFYLDSDDNLHFIALFLFIYLLVALLNKLALYHIKAKPVLLLQSPFSYSSYYIIVFVVMVACC